MKKDHEEIEKKLQELESAVLKEEVNHPSTVEKITSLEATKKQLPVDPSTLHNDLYYFSGIGFILTGIFLLFNHIKVATPALWAFGMSGAGSGLILIPLLAGIGWMIYDSKNKWAWLLTSMSCAVIFVSILNSMIMSFPATSLLGSIIMLAPLAVGAALLLKGMGGPKGIEDKMKK